ncbi:hypothetical protein D3C81_2104830 [compost metagenome]
MCLQQNLLASTIQMSTSSFSVKQLETKLRFQALHLGADRRLSEVDLTARGGECALPRYYYEGFEFTNH